MADKAHILTDKKLEEMERRLSAIYSEAQKDIQKKADEYFDKFKKADEEKRKLVKQGKLTDEEYRTWRQNKIMYGKRFTAMKEDVAKQLLNVNQTATAYINGELPEVYTLNYNALAETVDGVGGYSFTLTDRDTVKHLATTDKSLLPFRELDPAKDIPWNMKKINSQVLQGIIQGESIPNISKRIMNVQEMNKDAAIRSARTIVTGAENKGRMDSYHRAEQDGIILEKQWLAAIDSRTRDWHAELNGVTVPIDEPFENAIGKIMFPGDPSADGANVYNCRCTLVSKIKGFKKAQVEKSLEQKQEGTITQAPKAISGKDLSGQIDYSSTTKGLDIETAIHAQGFDGLPRVVSNEEFDEALKKSNFYAERTYSAPTQEVLDAYREELYHGKWYVDCSEGGSQYGKGMYCAARYEDGKYIIPHDNKIGYEMSHYQEIGISKGNNFYYTEGLTLEPDAKIFVLPHGVKTGEYIPTQYQNHYLLTHTKGAEHEAVKRYIKASDEIDRAYQTGNYTAEVLDPLYEVKDKAQSEISKEIFDEAGEAMKYYPEGFTKYGLYKDEGTLVAEMGYDAINAEGHGEGGSYTVILNRTKVIFREGGSKYGN